MSIPHPTGLQIKRLGTVGDAHLGALRGAKGEQIKSSVTTAVSGCFKAPYSHTVGMKVLMDIGRWAVSGNAFSGRSLDPGVEVGGSFLQTRDPSFHLSFRWGSLPPHYLLRSSLFLLFSLYSLPLSFA